MRRRSPPGWRTLLVFIVAVTVLAAALAWHRGPQAVAEASASVASLRPSPSPQRSTVARATPEITPPTVQGSLPSGAASTGATSPEFAPGAELTLIQLLNVLPVAPEDRTGYDRSLFRHWIDADGDGCDTRREVLIAEAVVAPTVGGGCSLVGGEWISAYDGEVLTDASQLQIDHVVALAEAWDSGASVWTADRRMRFANDLDVSWALIAVSGSSNQSKSDKDPADWLPPNAGDICPFVSAWIAIKVRWQLAVDPRERDALTGLVGKCPASRMPYEPVPAPVVLSATPPPGGPDCSPAYPTVCIPPPPPDLDCGDVPYRRFEVLPPDPHHFDGNHNGIGCEG